MCLFVRSGNVTIKGETDDDVITIYDSEYIISLSIGNSDSDCVLNYHCNDVIQNLSCNTAKLFYFFYEHFDVWLRHFACFCSVFLFVFKLQGITISW